MLSCITFECLQSLPKPSQLLQTIFAEGYIRCNSTKRSSQQKLATMQGFGAMFSGRQGSHLARAKFPLRMRRLGATAKVLKEDLPTSIKNIMLKDIQYQKIEQHQVPACIIDNPLWARVSPMVQEIYSLCDLKLADNTVAALLVVLKETEIKLVVKGVPATRAKYSTQEVASELQAAELFAGNPLLATTQAMCHDADGNLCSIMPYAGCSLESLLGHPDWFEKTSSQDRLELVKGIVSQNLMAYKAMQNKGVGYIFRDVKPGNICVDPVTGVAAVIDYELMMPTTKEDFFFGETPGYHTPELVAGADHGKSLTSAQRKAATNSTMDVFLTSFVALQAAVGLHDLPWQLQVDRNDSKGGLSELLGQHAAAAAAGYAALIARVPCPVARDFFNKTMCANPARRPTPAQALKHKWLARHAAAVKKALATLTPSHQQQSQLLAEMFADVKGVILPQQPHKLSAAVSVRLSVSLDVSNSTTTSGSSTRQNSRAGISNSCSSRSLDGGRAAGDQLPAAAFIAATDAAKKATRLLQQGKRLLLSKLSMKDRTGDKDHQVLGQNCSGGADGESVEAAVATVEVQGWIDDSPQESHVQYLLLASVA